MTTVLGIVVGIAVASAIVMAIGRRLAAQGVDPTQLTFEPQLMAEVKLLIAKGEKLQAIKLLRDRTPGLALLTAKTIVDRLSASAAPATGALKVDDGAADLSFESDDLSFQELADYLPSSSPVDLDVELEARRLKSEGQPIAAIKLIREHTGMGLKDAKDFVDSLV